MAIGDKIPVEAIKKALAENPVLKWVVIGFVAIFAVEFLAKEGIKLASDGLNLYRMSQTIDGDIDATQNKNRANGSMSERELLERDKESLRIKTQKKAEATAATPAPTNDWARKRNAGIVAALGSAIVIACVRGAVRTQGIVALCGPIAMLGLAWLAYHSTSEAWLGEEFGLGIWVDVGTSLVTSGALLICAVTVIGAAWHTLRGKTG